MSDMTARCPHCHGQGTVWVSPCGGDGTGDDYLIDCPVCGGKVESSDDHE